MGRTLESDVYKRDVVRPLHKTRFVEHDADADIVYISPLGIKQVEEHILGKEGSPN